MVDHEHCAAVFGAIARAHDVFAISIVVRMQSREPPLLHRGLVCDLVRLDGRIDVKIVRRQRF